MAKVVLVQYWLIDHLGVMAISSFLKEFGHESVILIRHEERDFIKAIRDINPDIVGFSCTTGIHSYALEDARNIKRYLPNIITIMGGAHATFCPDIINQEGLDIVCRGEGEGAILELCNRIDRHSGYSDMQNLWVKDKGEIYKNELRPLIGDLDELPFADRKHYENYKIMKTMTGLFISPGRGCPHSCSFCHNLPLRNIYEGKGKYLRFRSIDNLFKEIDQSRKNRFIEYISFENDTFLENREWSRDFFAVYKKHISLPYTCNTRVDNLSEDIIIGLKSSGCYLVSVGIESGNEEIRESILNKKLKTSDILNVAKILKKNRLKFRTYNMIGLPGETVDQAIDTVVLNTEIKTDFPMGSIFQPYPGTPISESLVLKGAIKSNYCDLSPSYLKGSIIQQPNIRELENLQRLFYLLVKKHPFQNGNKRIAMTALFVFLYKNNKWLKADTQELYNFTMWIAQSPPKYKEETLRAIQKFLKEKIIALK